MTFLFGFEGSYFFHFYQTGSAWRVGNALFHKLMRLKPGITLDSEEQVSNTQKPGNKIVLARPTDHRSVWH